MRRRRSASLLVAVAAVVLLGAGAVQRHGAARAADVPTARQAGAEVLAFSEAHPAGPARGALSAHLGHLAGVAPAWLTLGPHGTFDYLVRDPFVAGLADRGASVLPVLRDPDRRAGALLANGPLRRRLALRLSVGLRALGADGVVLDVGGLPASARARYPAFVRELRGALGAGRAVYVTVPAVTDARSARAARGYDLRDLARPALLIVRTWNQHDDHTRPGPVASLRWFQRAVRHALANAPRARVLVGVPTWGWAWTPHGAARATQADLFARADAARLARRDGTPIGLPDGTAWVETDRSVQLKLEVVRAAKARGVALWVRGGESAALWRQPVIR